MSALSKIKLNPACIDSLENKGVSFINDNGVLFLWHSAGFHYSIEVKS